jgi:hypothetical protein
MSPIIELMPYPEKDFNNLFGNRWKPVFKQWFIDNFDLIILDGILVDGGIDYNLINNSVKPILFFTKCLSTTLLNENVISNFDVSDNFEILTLHFKSCGNDGKVYDLFHNNSLVGEIMLTGLI